MALSETEIRSLRDQIRDLSARLISDGDEETLARLRSGDLLGSDGFFDEYDGLTEEEAANRNEADEDSPEYKYAHDVAGAEGAAYESRCSGSYYNPAAPDPMHYGLPDDVEVEMEYMDGRRPVRLYRPKTVIQPEGGK